jgi:hypothetical protein
MQYVIEIFFKSFINLLIQEELTFWLSTFLFLLNHFWAMLLGKDYAFTWVYDTLMSYRELTPYEHKYITFHNCDTFFWKRSRSKESKLCNFVTLI